MAEILKNPRLPKMILDVQKTQNWFAPPQVLYQGDKGYVQPFQFTENFETYNVTADDLGFNVVKPDGNVLKYDRGSGLFNSDAGSLYLTLPAELTQAPGIATCYIYAQNADGTISASTTRFTYNIQPSFTDNEGSISYVADLQKLQDQFKNAINGASDTIAQLKVDSTDYSSQYKTILDNMRNNSETWLNDQEDALGKKYDEANANLSKLNSDFLQKYKDAVGALDPAKLDAEYIEKLNKVVNDITAKRDADLAKIKNDVKDAEDQITGDVNAYKNSIDRDLKDLTDKLDTLKQDVPDLNKQIENAQDKLQAIQDNIKDLDLSSYALKSDVYTKDQVDGLLKEAGKVKGATINGGAEITPNDNGILNLTIQNQGGTSTPSDLSDYAKTKDVEDALANKADKTDLDNYALKTDLDGKANTSDLDNYALKTELDGKANESELADYAKKSDLDSKANKDDLNDLVNTTTLQDYDTIKDVDKKLADKVNTNDLSQYAQTTDLDGKANTSDLENYALKTDLNSKANKSDLTSYDTTDDVNSKLAGKADKTDLDSKANVSDLAKFVQGASINGGAEIKPDKDGVLQLTIDTGKTDTPTTPEDLSDYAKKADVNNSINAINDTLNKIQTEDFINKDAPNVDSTFDLNNQWVGCKRFWGSTPKHAPSQVGPEAYGFAYQAEMSKAGSCLEILITTGGPVDSNIYLRFKGSNQWTDWKQFAFTTDIDVIQAKIDSLRGKIDTANNTITTKDATNVKSVSINGGTPVSPTNGNVDLTVNTSSTDPHAIHSITANTHGSTINATVSDGKATLDLTSLASQEDVDRLKQADDRHDQTESSLSSLIMAKANTSDLDGYATQADLANYDTTSDVDNKLANKVDKTDLDNYALKTDIPSTSGSNGFLSNLPDGAPWHNLAYQNKKIPFKTDDDRNKFWKSISDGTFKDLYLGNYIDSGDISNVKSWGLSGFPKLAFRIAGFNYQSFQFSYQSIPTVVMVVDRVMSTQQMFNNNLADQNDTSRNFYDSDIFNKTLLDFSKALSTAFGSNHLVPFWEHCSLLQSSGDTVIAKGDAQTGVGGRLYTNLLNENMLYGKKLTEPRVTYQKACDANNKDLNEYNVGSEWAQLPLMARDSAWIASDYNAYWLRDQTQADEFVCIGESGLPTKYLSNNLCIVRPFFYLGVLPDDFDIKTNTTDPTY